jgi:3-hydroxyacyl-CoA dehydrogenase
MAKANRLAIIGLVAGLLGGGAAGVALTASGTASGASSTTTSTTTRSRADVAKSYLEDTLAPLVKNGTITQAQADAVIKAIEDARPDGKIFRHRFGPGRGMFVDLFSVAAKKIGVSVDDLRSALRDGKSIADVAKSKNVDPQAVVDAIVAALQKNVDQAVKDGKLTKSEADARLNAAKTHISAFINGTAPKFGDHPPFRGFDHGLHHGGWNRRGDHAA